MEPLCDAAEVPPCPTQELRLATLVLQRCKVAAAHQPRQGSAIWMSTSILWTDLPCFADLFKIWLRLRLLPTLLQHCKKMIVSKPTPPTTKKKPITKQHKQATYCTLNEATSSAVTIRINNAW